MIIIRLTGGLGNQMFQYSAGRATALRNKTNLILDTTYYEVDFDKQSHESSLLLNIFPNINAMELQSIDREELASIINNSKRPQVRVINKIKKLLKLPASYHNLLEEKLLTYQASFHTSRANILHLSSDWQNEKYFADYGDTIKNDFKFPALEPDSLNSKLLADIVATESVSVHVRRGDYLISVMHQPTSLSYYNKALEELSRVTSNPKFFVFSDDIAWCKDNLNLPDAVYVNHNSGDKSYIDMQLMSNCKHNIIANSSFSWWGAWLNNNTQKIVIAPEIWLAKSGITSDNVIPSTWISI